MLRLKKKKKLNFLGAGFLQSLEYSSRTPFHCTKLERERYDKLRRHVKQARAAKKMAVAMGRPISVIKFSVCVTFSGNIFISGTT